MGEGIRDCALRLDQIQPALDQTDVAGHSVDAVGQVCVLSLKQADALLQLDEIGFDLAEVAPHRSEKIEDQIW